MAQWKARSLDGRIDYFLEPASKKSPAYFIATSDDLSVRFPLRDVPDERLLIVGVEKLKAYLWTALERLEK